MYRGCALPRCHGKAPFEVNWGLGKGRIHGQSFLCQGAMSSWPEMSLFRNTT